MKWALPFALAVCAADQWSKHAVFRLDPPVSIDVIPGFFRIIQRTNPGGVFGLFHDGGWANGMFLVVSVAAVGFLVWLSLKSTLANSRLFQGSIGAILGGAVGNLIDRVRFGHVLDFLDFYVGSWSWPTFNVADSAICVGTAILAILYYREDTRENAAKSSPEPSDPS